MYGPLEYVVIQFTENRFTGELLPVLLDIEAEGCVGLIDLAFVSKDEVGNLILLEIGDMDAGLAAAYEPLVSEFHGLLTAEDVAIAAVELAANASAAVLLLEHHWALDLQLAVRVAGGRMLDSGYIHPETQAAVIDVAIDMEIEENDYA
jgi:hypothetical protein